MICPHVRLPRGGPRELHVPVGCDWAGCRTTRKSTSGGVLCLLACPFHHYARTQQTIATSSAESDFFSMGTGTSDGLGVVNFLHEAQLAL